MDCNFMKTRTTLCTLMCVLIPLNTQALPKLSQLFPCLKKHAHAIMNITHIPTPTIAQRCLLMSTKIAQSKITKAAVATTILCICAKKAWNYIQSLRAQLRGTSDQLRTERTRNQRLEQQITEQNHQAATQAEQLTQTQRQVQEQQQEKERLTERLVQPQKETALSEESHKMQSQNTRQALEALQNKIDNFQSRATKKLDAHGHRLTTVGEQLKQLKDTLTRKVKAPRPSSTKKGKSSSEPSSHPVRSPGLYDASQQPLTKQATSNRIHHYRNRQCEACKKPAQTPH